MLYGNRGEAHAEETETSLCLWWLSESDKAVAKASVKKTYEAAVELFAMLCQKYALDPLADGVILSHREGHARGIASNHGDPEHLWNQLGMGYTMDGFRKAVKEAMGAGEDAPVEEEKYYRVRKTWSDTASQLGAYTVLDNAKAMADQHHGYVVFDWNGAAVYGKTEGTGMTNADCPFMMRVTIPDLNIREGAGTNTDKTGKYTGVGVFTSRRLNPVRGPIPDGEN